MSLLGYQQAINELVVSPALREEVARLTPPELPAALAAFELTERERRRLHAVARDRGMAVATLLHRSSRLSRLANTMPRTCQALGPERLKEVVHRFWKEQLPTSAMYLHEARRFGEFLRERLDSGELADELLPDLMEAELASAELLKEGKTPSPDREQPLEGAALEEARLERSPWCRVIPFLREPRAVLRALDHLPAHLPEGPLYLVLEGVAYGRVSRHVVDARRGRALLASTGERSVARLCAELDCPPALFRELLERGFLWRGSGEEVAPPGPLGGSGR